MIKRILLAFGRGLTLLFLFTINAIGQTTVASSLQLDYLQPGNYIIEDIKITGNSTLDPEAILAISSLSVGDTIRVPGPAIVNAVERIWQQKIIKDVSVYVSQVIGNRIILSINILESPRLSAYVVEGISKKEKTNLAEQINLVRGKIITPKLIKSLKHTIKLEFAKQGYRDVKVAISTMPDPTDPTYSQLKIDINKGEKFIIDKIIINGNNHIRSELLKTHLKHIQEHPRFTLVKDVLYKIFTLQPIKKGGVLWKKPTFEETMVYLKTHCIPFSSKFIKQEYQADKHLIIDYYKAQGYRDVAIVKDTVYKSRQGRLNIALDIEEGQKYYIRSIHWVGNSIYDSSTLDKVLNIRPGTTYSSNLLQERLRGNPVGMDVSSLYMDNGYLFFNVDPVEVAIQGNQVDLELRVQEGVQATINNIDIRGNIYTHDYVIRRELKTVPGEKFSRAKLIRSQRELAMLNVFDPRKIEILPLPNPADNTVDLLYKVKESPNFTAKAGATLASQGKLGFHIDLGTNNFSLSNALRGKIPLGDVQSLYIKAAFSGKAHQDFSLNFTEPWLMGQQPTSFSLGINKSFHEYQNEGSSKDAAKENKQHKGFLGTFGIKAALGRRLNWPDDYFIFKSGITYHLYNYKQHDVFSDNLLLDGITHELAFDVTLERNSLDQPNYPMSGSLASLHLKFTPPYSLFSESPSGQQTMTEKLKRKEYHQTMIDFAWYYNLSGDWVLNLFANSGFLGSYSFNQPIGMFERFSMGGKGALDFSLLGNQEISLRGYPEGYLFPVDQKTGYKGGVIFDKIGVELRHPIIKSTMVFVYGLAFAEAGNTWANYSNWQLTDLKRSVGLGLRLYLPLIGSIGLDWGYGFDRAGTEKLELHWSLGAGSR